MKSRPPFWRMRRPQRPLKKSADLLFSVVNVARHAGVDPDKAMTDANAKFTRRFRAVETRLADENKTAALATLTEMDVHWDQVKRDEG